MERMPCLDFAILAASQLFLVASADSVKADFGLVASRLQCHNIIPPTIVARQSIPGALMLPTTMFLKTLCALIFEL